MKYVLVFIVAFFSFIPLSIALDPSPDFATPDIYRVPCNINYDPCMDVNKIDVGSSYAFYDCGYNCSPVNRYGKSDAYHDSGHSQDVANCGWGYDTQSIADSTNAPIYIYLKNVGWYSDLPGNLPHRVQTSLNWKMYYTSNCTGTPVLSGGDMEFKNNFYNTYVQCEGEGRNSCLANASFTDPSVGQSCPAIDTIINKPFYTGVVSYKYTVLTRIYHSGNSGTYYWAQDEGCFQTEWF